MVMMMIALSLGPFLKRKFRNSLSGGQTCDLAPPLPLKLKANSVLLQAEEVLLGDFKYT